MGIKYIVLGTVFLAACSSSSAPPTGAGSPTDRTKVGQGDGSQTGGEGSIAGCRRVSATTISAEEARLLDFPVDEQLALFDQTFEASFHRGNLDCSALPASSDGHIQTRASLLGIDREQFVSASDRADDCPSWRREILKYRAQINLTTDDGTLEGSFESTASVGHPAPGNDPVLGLRFTGAEFAPLSGSLGIRVDSARPHVPRVSLQIALGVTPWPSQVFTLVDYTDGGDPLQDQGDGMFWPPDFRDGQDQGMCGWLDYPVPQRAPISIDAYKAL
jgi:hypothetical protein